MDVAAVYLDLYGRIPPLAREVVEGTDLATLTTAPAPGANTIAWLVWHMARVQDHYTAELGGQDQVWVTGEWAGRFGLGPDPRNTGYGHTPAEVAAVRPDRPELLTGYLGATDARLQAFVSGLGPSDLDRIVDTNWDPPVTLGARLVSVGDDCLQHVGQAAYVKGLLAR